VTGAGLFNPDHRVKLFDQHRFEVVTATLGFGAINHPDGALQQWFGQYPAQRRALRVAPVRQRRRHAGLEELMFPTVRATAECP
jgi:hypothetical protein